MHKIDGAGHLDGQFVSEDAASGRAPTLVTPEWLNAVQGELLSVIEAAGMTPSKLDSTQLLSGIKTLIEARVGDYVMSTNIGNEYTVALDPVVISYTATAFFAFKSSAANTGATTLNAGGGAKALVREDGTPMRAGDIASGAVVTVVFDMASDSFRATEIVASQIAALIPSYGLFYKANPNAVVFTKTGATTLQIKAGTRVEVAGTMVVFSNATSVTMPTLTAGEDYSIWVKDDGTLQAVADPYSSPASAPGAGNWRKIGGFHYGLVGSGTTVAGGGFATTGNGMIWTQGDVDAIAGIVAYSLWDLRWTINSIDRQPRGMALDPWVGAWAAIYFCSSNHITNGISRFNTDVASGTVLPRKPLVYGGNGTTTYANGNWWTFNEIAASFGLRLPTEREFQSAAFGVTENQSLGGSSVTIPATGRQAGYTSRIGCEQTTGHMWIWGADSSTRWDGVGGWNWRDSNGGRGQIYLGGDINLVRVLLSGSRGVGSFSGSRASNWNDSPWGASWSVAFRAFGDLLVL